MIQVLLHYCAMTQDAPGVVRYVDGTITTEASSMLNPSWLSETREKIANQMTPSVPAEKITILSMTYLREWSE